MAVIERIVEDEKEPTVIEIRLTVAEQRALVEAQTGEPCFRMWLTRQEYERGSFSDWPEFELSDGRIAIWRKESDLDTLQTTNAMVWRAIMERRIDDDVI